MNVRSPNQSLWMCNSKSHLIQIDVLEEAVDGLDNVIVLQTVLEEVRHRSSPVYKRLKVRKFIRKRNLFLKNVVAYISLSLMGPRRTVEPMTVLHFRI